MDKRRAMITGGGGFLGRHIVRRFEQAGFVCWAPRSAEHDLRTHEGVRRAFEEFSPDVVVHAAADAGGIGHNRAVPASIYRNNLLMGIHILDGVRDFKPEKFVIVGSACAYPGEATDVLRERDFFNGPMHPSVEAYGLSKRALYLGARAYEQQHGTRSVFLILTNMYGPWDHFDPEDSHVVAALIRKFVEATDRGDREVVCWGTGSAIREFLYVEDAADAIYESSEHVDDLAPMNVGTGVGTSIKELAELLADVCGFEGRIEWDISKPDGAPRKILDVHRLTGELDWRPKTSFKEGLRETIAWFREHRPT